MASVRLRVLGSAEERLLGVTDPQAQGLLIGLYEAQPDGSAAATVLGIAHCSGDLLDEIGAPPSPHADEVGHHPVSTSMGGS